MSTVTVCGRAHARVQPDFATVELVVSHVADTAADALKRVAAKSTSLENLLDRLGIAPKDWITGQVSVSEEREWRGDHNEFVGHRATAGVEVRVDELSNLSPLLREAVDTAGALVAAIRWAIEPTNTARTQLLADAARDARSRAETYASALGCKLGPLEIISELPIDGSHGPTPHPQLAAKLADTQDLSISPGGLDLTAEVHVRFEVVPAATRGWR